MSKRHILAAGMLAAALTAGCQSHKGPCETNITDTLATRADFKTFVNALEAADLTKTLRDEGPFTVLAPTDEAFDQLPAGTMESLLKPDNRKRLRTILNNHIVPGQVMAIDLIGMQKLGTLTGEKLNVNVVDGKIMIDGATVTKTDIAATNGVIHVIDAVLMPKED